LKINILHILLFLSGLHISAQKLSLNLTEGKCIVYKKKLFIYGFHNNCFKVYKANTDLHVTDSLVYQNKNFQTNNFLSAEADTIQSKLNFYLQKKDKLSALILKTDTSFTIKEEFNNIDITKLKPYSGSAEQFCFTKDDYFVVKSAIDTSGKQFYLSKYTYKTSEKNPFAYDFIWQFNFERQHISNIHIFKTDSNAVFAYVQIKKGLKQGQWLLKINTKTGQLIKSKRLNFNPDLNYRFGNYTSDTIQKETLILGQITRVPETAAGTPTLFIARFDSTFDYLEQKQLQLKIIPANPKLKTNHVYLTQLPIIKKEQDGSYNIFTDVYRKDGKSYKYHTSGSIPFKKTGDEWELPVPLFKEFTEIESFYSVKDPSDPNGKLEEDTLRDNNTLFYKAPMMPVKIDFQVNENNAYQWFLMKTDFKSNMVKAVQLKPGAKSYSVIPVFEMNKDLEPQLIHLSEEKILFTHKPNNNTILIEIIN